MFLDNSRYLKVPTVTVATRDGRTVTALKLRPLPATSGTLYSVKEGDQLDVMAEESFADGTKFWHVADANTALEAPRLVAVAGSVVIRPNA